jgi:hypothetical protein
MARLDVLVSPVATLRAGVLAGIAFYRDHELRFGLHAPHRVNQVAGILSAQLRPNWRRISPEARGASFAVAPR